MRIQNNKQPKRVPFIDVRWRKTWLYVSAYIRRYHQAIHDVYRRHIK